MSTIYHLHADTTGTDSIQDLIDAKRIVHIPIPNIDVYDRVCHKLLTVVTPSDTVVLDTINEMGATTRVDIRYGTDPNELLFERYGVITNKKGEDNYAPYTNAANMIMRRLKNLHARGASICTTSHEDEKVDSTDLRKKRNIALNDEFRKMLEHASSDIFRLSQTMGNIINPDNGEIQVPKGTRLLHIRRTDEVMAKIQLTIEQDVALMDAGIEVISLPRGDGGWSKMRRIIGKEPRWLTVYGPPGVGKTNFVLRRGPEPTPQPKAVKEENAAA